MDEQQMMDFLGNHDGAGGRVWVHHGGHAHEIIRGPVGELQHGPRIYDDSERRGRLSRSPKGGDVVAGMTIPTFAAIGVSPLGRAIIEAGVQAEREHARRVFLSSRSATNLQDREHDERYSEAPEQRPHEIQLLAEPGDWTSESGAPEPPVDEAEHQADEHEQHGAKTADGTAELLAGHRASTTERGPNCSPASGGDS